VQVPPHWCREDPAACRVGSEGLKQRGRQPIRVSIDGQRLGVRSGGAALAVARGPLPWQQCWQQSTI
jgi:hypothetical protein